MTVEEMIKMVTPDPHIGGICLDTDECLQVIALLRAGQAMRMCGTTTGAALRAAHKAWDDGVEENK